MEEKNQTNAKRNIALKVNISDILNGEYVKEDGWTPNFVSTDKGHVSRVNIIGVIVSKEESTFDSLIIDDSTGNISIRSFENREILKAPKVGDIVQLIGRVREYNGQKYVLAEIVRPIDDKRWVIVRKKELEMSKPVTEMPPLQKLMENKITDTEVSEPKEPKKEQIIPKKEEMILQPQSNPYEIILGLIKSLDTGFGVSYEEIILNSKLKNSEEVITALIEEGEIFEIRPGILKVL
jgi:hypothetical protein